MRSSITLPILVLTCFLLGCSSKENASPSTSLTDLRVADLERQVQSLKEDQASEMRSRSAVLIPSDKGYSNLLTDAGTLAVSLQNVQTYADGSRVQLRIGNLTSGEITKLKATVRWGPTDKDGNFIGDPRIDILRAIDGPFPPGTWHDATLDLSGIPPTKLGKIELADGLVESVSLHSQ